MQVILDGMQWLGLDADEGPVLPDAALRPLPRSAGSRCSPTGTPTAATAPRKSSRSCARGSSRRKQKPRYDGRCRDLREQRPGVEPVIRFRNPLDGEVVVDDQVHGRVVFQNSELDDLIIARSDGNPTYNFCVVVDDIDMGVTHVIRGDDHLNNTPRQMNMLRALGAAVPVYAHVPMILGADGAKLSKRHGAVSVLQYQEEGYLPDALLNYLVRLGWSHGDQEVFTREEMIAAFDIRDVNKAASAFNAEKLLWLNQQHMMRAPLGAAGGRAARAAGAAGRPQRRCGAARRGRQRAARALQDAEGDGAEQPVFLSGPRRLRSPRRRRSS